MSTKVVEQVVRPTGLIDPEIIVKPTKGQIDDLVAEINARVEADARVLVTTLTKKMSGNITDYLLELGTACGTCTPKSTRWNESTSSASCGSVSSTCWSASTCCARASTFPRCHWSRSSTPTRKGLRTPTSLIQTVGHAARNVDGQVIMYADQMTDSMTYAISETMRRRKKQLEYNEEHGIDPQTVRKKVTDILEMAFQWRRRRRRRRCDGGQGPGPGAVRDSWQSSHRPTRLTSRATSFGRLIQSLTDEMHDASPTSASKRPHVSATRSTT